MSIPTAEPKVFNGIWTDHAELHNQKSLNTRKHYRLKRRDEEEFLKTAHPPPTTHTKDIAYARMYRGDYLLHTCWEWELDYEALAT